MSFHQMDIYRNIVTSFQPCLFIYSQLQLRSIFLLLVKPHFKKKNTARLLRQHFFFPPCDAAAVFAELQSAMKSIVSWKAAEAASLWISQGPRQLSWSFVNPEWRWLDVRAIVSSPRDCLYESRRVYLVRFACLSQESEKKKGPCGFLFIPLQNNYHITRWKN